jgi:hypothetical protein
MAMPKHFSIVGCGGFGPATAGAAIMARAAANEQAIVAGEIALFEFIGDPFRKRRRNLRSRPLNPLFLPSKSPAMCRLIANPAGLL